MAVVAAMKHNDSVAEWLCKLGGLHLKPSPSLKSPTQTPNTVTTHSHGPSVESEMNEVLTIQERWIFLTVSITWKYRSFQLDFEPCGGRDFSPWQRLFGT